MIKTAKELAARAKAAATEYKSLYVLGAFGWPMMESMKERAIKAQSYNQKAARKAKIKAVSKDTFGFDCGGLIKALLWGWMGDTSKSYGGAVYASNGVPDKSANQLIKACTDVSNDFSNLLVGELLWIDGHVGIYIGDGLAVECTHRWDDGVQITAVHNLGKKSGYNGRTWTKHGRLPYVSYKEGYDLSLRNLQKGATGEDVKALQYLMMGFGSVLTPSGDFDSATEAAVRVYQRSKGLTVDGIVGRVTMSSLLGVDAGE